MQLGDRRLEPCDVLVSLLYVGEGVARGRVPRPLQGWMAERLSKAVPSVDGLILPGAP